MKWIYYTARKACSRSRSRQLFSPASILYSYKFTIQPCNKYCGHICSRTSAMHSEILDRIQRISKVSGPDLLSQRQ